MSLTEDIDSTSYASMRSNAQQAADFLPILSQALEDAGYDVGIICCEATGWDVTKDLTGPGHHSFSLVNGTVGSTGTNRIPFVFHAGECPFAPWARRPRQESE